MKAFKKILLILIITIIALILLEYLYSQRWRLTKSVPVEQYPEYIVGEWISVTPEIYMDYQFNLVTKKESLSFEQNGDYDFTMNSKIHQHDSIWEIQDSTLILKSNIYDNIPSVLDNSINEEVENITTYTDIYFLGNDFLILEKEEDNLTFLQIPRKQVYKRD